MRKTAVDSSCVFPQASEKDADSITRGALSDPNLPDYPDNSLIRFEYSLNHAIRLTWD